MPTGAPSMPTFDKGGPPSGAALLAVGIREAHALVGDAVDVGRAIAHHPVAVAAEIPDADTPGRVYSAPAFHIVAPDDACPSWPCSCSSRSCWVSRRWGRFRWMFSRMALLSRSSDGAERCSAHFGLRGR